MTLISRVSFPSFEGPTNMTGMLPSRKFAPKAPGLDSAVSFRVAHLSRTAPPTPPCGFAAGRSAATPGPRFLKKGAGPYPTPRWPYPAGRASANKGVF